MKKSSLLIIALLGIISCSHDSSLSEIQDFCLIIQTKNSTEYLADFILSQQLFNF